jgi:hypothetical protein
MFYCAICDCLPGQPKHHLTRERHRQAVSRLQRPEVLSDFAARKVLKTEAGHYIALLLCPFD